MQKKDRPARIVIETSRQHFLHLAKYALAHALECYGRNDIDLAHEIKILQSMGRALDAIGIELEKSLQKLINGA